MDAVIRAEREAFARANSYTLSNGFQVDRSDVTFSYVAGNADLDGLIHGSASLFTVDSSSMAVAPNSAGGSALGNALSNIPLIGGVLGGVGNIISGVGNVVLGAVTGNGATVSTGFSQIGNGGGSVITGSLNLAGKVWNSPNTAIGLTLGVVGWALGGSAPTIGNNAIQFGNNPILAPSFMPAGLTLGNAINYAPGYTPNITPRGQLNTVGQHEIQHTYQGEITGPLYIPLNLLGKGIGLLINGDAEGSANFMEKGSYSYPARPWPWK